MYFNIVLCTELILDEEFVIIDGIRVRKDSLKNKTSGSDNDSKRGKESRGQEGDEVIEKEDNNDDDDEIDYDDDEELEATKHLPTKCHGKVKSNPELFQTFYIYYNTNYRNRPMIL